MLYRPFKSAGINISPLQKISVFAVFKDPKDQDLLTPVRKTSIVTPKHQADVWLSSTAPFPPFFLIDFCPSNWLPPWSMSTHTTVQTKPGTTVLPSARDQSWVLPFLGCSILFFWQRREDRPAVPTQQVCPVLLSSLPDLCCSVRALRSPSQLFRLSCYFNII